MSARTGIRLNVRNLLIASLIMVSAFGFALTRSVSARDGERSLEDRLQRVEDEKEIRDVMILYGQYLDTLNFTDYSHLFAKEGTWSGGTTNNVPVKGPKLIRSTMEKAFAERMYDPEHVTNLHLLSNIKIDVDGDRAKGYSKWTVMSRTGNDEPFIRRVGHYDDVFIREDGRWKILSRAAIRDISR